MRVYRNTYFICPFTILAPLLVSVPRKVNTTAPFPSCQKAWPSKNVFHRTQV